jgi:hypothetical protein
MLSTHHRQESIVAPRSDQPHTRKSRTRAKAQSVDPATQRAPNAAEASPETLVPEVVHTDLTRESVSSDDRHRWITERAYELAAERGFMPGAELDDWLQAEREFESKMTSQARPEDQFTG